MFVDESSVNMNMAPDNKPIVLLQVEWQDLKHIYIRRN